MWTNLIKQRPAAKADDRPEVPGCLFSSERDALEALEPSDALLDAGAGLVEGACEEGWLVLFVGLVGNNGSDAARSFAASRLALLASPLSQMTARG